MSALKKKWGDEMERCSWANSELDVKYHDKEWGRSVHDDKTLFEFLVLEGMQAGLSWSTILNKRETMRIAFDGFSINKIADYDERKVEELLNNPGIIRNKLKIKAMITNAQQFSRIQQEYGTFDKFIWAFVDYKPILNSWKKLTDIPASTEISDMMSKVLKKKGFKFVGTTICYAYMQAIGMVNDHLLNCPCRLEIIEENKEENK